MRFLILVGMLLWCVVTPELGAQVPKKSEVPRLIKELRQSSNNRVRAAAAEQLGALGAVRAAYVKDALEPLVEALQKDKSTEVRVAAARALATIRPAAKVAVPPLTEALKDKAPAVQIAAAMALPAFGAEARAALPLLKELSESKNKNLAQAAKEAIGIIASGS